MSKTARPVLERILEKSEIAESGCWEWTGGKTTTAPGKGYGLIQIGSRTDGSRRKVLVHRLMFTFLVRPIPDGLTIDHLCRNRACVNPLHLEPVTLTENIRRKPSATHCPKGHPFDETNTRWEGGTHRVCITCKHEWARLYRRAKGIPERKPKGAPRG